MAAKFEDGKYIQPEIYPFKQNLLHKKIQIIQAGDLIRSIERIQFE
jgi:hypothetical protein